jgi:hypothetical protein
MLREDPQILDDEARYKTLMSEYEKEIDGIRVDISRAFLTAEQRAKMEEYWSQNKNEFNNIWDTNFNIQDRKRREAEIFSLTSESANSALSAALIGDAQSMHLNWGIIDAAMSKKIQTKSLTFAQASEISSKAIAKSAVQYAFGNAYKDIINNPNSSANQKNQQLNALYKDFKSEKNKKALSEALVNEFKFASTNAEDIHIRLSDEIDNLGIDKKIESLTRTAAAQSAAASKKSNPQVDLYNINQIQINAQEVERKKGTYFALLELSEHTNQNVGLDRTLNTGQGLALTLATNKITDDNNQEISLANVNPAEVKPGLLYGEDNIKAIKDRGEIQYEEIAGLNDAEKKDYIAEKVTIAGQAVLGNDYTDGLNNQGNEEAKEIDTLIQNSIIKGGATTNISTKVGDAKITSDIDPYTFALLSKQKKGVLTKEESDVLDKNLKQIDTDLKKKIYYALKKEIPAGNGEAAQAKTAELRKAEYSLRNINSTDGGIIYENITRNYDNQFVPTDVAIPKKRKKDILDLVGVEGKKIIKNYETYIKDQNVANNMNALFDNKEFIEKEIDRERKRISSESNLEYIEYQNFISEKMIEDGTPNISTERAKELTNEYIAGNIVVKLLGQQGIKPEKAKAKKQKNYKPNTIINTSVSANPNAPTEQNFTVKQKLPGKTITNTTK